VVVERACKFESMKWLGYIPGHGVWHVGMSYGLSLIAVWFVFMNAAFEKNYFAFKSIQERRIKCNADKCKSCNACLQKIFPIVTDHKPFDEQDISRLQHSVRFCKFCCIEWRKFNPDDVVEDRNAGEETAANIKEEDNTNHVDDTNGTVLVELEVGASQ